MTLLPASPNRSLVGPRAHTSILIDESTSMARIASTVMQTFNEYLDTLREQPAEVRASVWKFASEVESLAIGVPLMRVHYLTKETYHPAGSTVLYDALGTAIRTLDSQLGPADRALVVIVTDGEDTGSEHFDEEMIAAMVSLRIATGRWTFVFLGADPEVGASLGIDNLLKLGAGAEAFTAAMRELSAATEQYLLTDGSAKFFG